MAVLQGKGQLDELMNFSLSSQYIKISFFRTRAVIPEFGYHIASLFHDRESKNRSGAQICVSAEDRFPEIVMVYIIREELCLQAESAAFPVMCALLAVFDIREVGCVELDAGQVGRHIHDAAAGGVHCAGNGKHAAVTGVAIDHEIVIISAREDHLRFAAVYIKAEGFGR